MWLYSISSHKKYGNPKRPESFSYPRQNMMPQKLKVHLLLLFSFGDLHDHFVSSSGSSLQNRWMIVVFCVWPPSDAALPQQLHLVSEESVSVVFGCPNSEILDIYLCLTNDVSAWTASPSLQVSYGDASHSNRESGIHRDHIRSFRPARRAFDPETLSLHKR